MAWVGLGDEEIREVERFASTLPPEPTYPLAPTYPERISDGLGHYWDSAVQDWRNENDGSLYNPAQSYAQPQDEYFGNFDANDAYNSGGVGLPTFPTSPSRAQFQDFDLAPPPPPTRAQFLDFDLAPPVEEPSWNELAMEGQFTGGFNPGSFFGGIGDVAQDIYASDFVQRNPMFGSDITAVPQTDGPGLTLQNRAQTVTEDVMSGNEFTRDVTRNVFGNEIDPGQLPYNLDKLTDVGLAPATWLTAGLGPSVPVIGSTFGGSFGTRLLGETAVGTAGLLGSEAATSDVAESIPGFGAQPDWLQGLEGGLIGGVGAFGGIRGVRGLGPEDFAPSGAPKSIYDETGPFPKLGSEAQYPAFGGVDVPQGGAFPRVAGAADEPIWKTTKAVPEYQGRLPGDRLSDVLGADIRQVHPTEDFAEDRVEEIMAAMQRGETLPPIVAEYSATDAPYDILDVIDGHHRLEAARRLGITEVPVRIRAEAEDTGVLDLILPPKNGGATVPPVPPISNRFATASLDDHRRRLLEALDAERKFRTSGQADEIIHAGRVQQATGIGSAIEGLGDDATFSSATRDLSRGAKTGTMLPSTTGLQLDEATQNALIKEAIEFNGGRNFDNLRAIKALDKLQKGERLQPAEITQLRRIYGDEIADAIAQTNAGRIQTVAELTPQDIADIARRAEVDGKKVATLEVQARAQHKLADDILERQRMDPTNPRLKKAAEDARARAIAKENEADRILAERAERLTQNLPQRTAAGIEQAEVSRLGTFEQAMKRDKALAAQEAAVRRAAEDEWIKGLDFAQPDEYAIRMGKLEDMANRKLSAAQERAKKAAGDKAAAEWARSLDYPGADEYAERLARNEATDMRRLGRQQDRAKAVQADRAATRDFTESGQRAIADAEKAIDKMDIPDSAKDALKETVAVQVRANGAILDALGDTGPSILRRAYAAATGEVTDSWSSALLSRTAFLQNALEQQGLSAKAARQIANYVRDAEVARRYGANVPKHVADSLEQAKRSMTGPDNAIQGAAAISQEFKNTAFGIGDVAAFGQNGFKSGLTSAPQILAGLVNRLANLAHIGIDTDTIGQSVIGKRAAYALDGISHSGSTGIVDQANGTLLRHIPGLSVVDRKLLSPTINFLTDLQFKHVLGWIRDVNYEGNLVLAKMAGADIQNPAVRAQAAKWANVASGAGTLAQRSNRANLEKATLLSASMTRAQGQQIGLVARGLTAGSRVDRVLAASTILSTVGTTLAIGKILNDYVGMDDFEFDPSKKGFGNITLGDGTVVNLFSQTQIPRTLAQSIRVLVDDGWNEGDLAEQAKIWGNLGMGRSSPALRIAEAAVGVGFEPGRGYRYGDYMEGQPLWKRLLSQAPIPPIVTQTQQEGLAPIRTAANVAGINAYPESKWGEFYRNVPDNFWDLPKEERDAYLAANPKAKAVLDEINAEELKKAQQNRDPEADRTLGFERLRQIDAERLSNEEQAVKLFQQDRDPETFRKRLDEIQSRAAIQRGEADQNFKLFKDTGELPTDPVEAAIVRYYDIYDRNRLAGVDLDFDAVEAEMAALEKEVGPEVWAKVKAEASDTVHHPEAQKIYDAKAKVRDSGYWEIGDRVFAAWVEQAGVPAEGKTADQFFDETGAEVFRRLKERGMDDYQAGVLTTQVMNKLTGPYSDMASEVRKAARESNPELMRALIEAGYYTPGKEASAKILAGAAP